MVSALVSYSVNLSESADIYRRGDIDRGISRVRSPGIFRSNSFSFLSSGQKRNMILIKKKVCSNSNRNFVFYR